MMHNNFLNPCTMNKAYAIVNIDTNTSLVLMNTYVTFIKRTCYFLFFPQRYGILFQTDYIKNLINMGGHSCRCNKDKLTTIMNVHCNYCVISVKWKTEHKFKALFSFRGDVFWWW